MITKEDLIAFEEEIAQCYKDKMIRAPIHLYHGNEEKMIEVFQTIARDDWVFCSWRSHYQCLLKGVPREEVKAAILKGKSISLCFPEYRVFSSAIVAGNIPIAVGVAMGIKMRGERDRVHCFIGDMTSETGMAWECFKYSMNHKLPIRFIVEDNGKSVCTDTRKTWNMEVLTFENANGPDVVHYTYQSKYPHAGIGNQRIIF